MTNFNEDLTMIKTTVTPDKQTVSITIPAEYVGKQVEILLYRIDEVVEGRDPVKKQPLTLRGALKLSDKEYNDIQQYSKGIRNEWDRAI